MAKKLNRLISCDINWGAAARDGYCVCVCVCVCICLEIKKRMRWALSTDHQTFLIKAPLPWRDTGRFAYIDIDMGYHNKLTVAST